MARSEFVARSVAVLYLRARGRGGPALGDPWARGGVRGGIGLRGATLRLLTTLKPRTAPIRHPLALGAAIGKESSRGSVPAAGQGGSDEQMFGAK